MTKDPFRKQSKAFVLITVIQIHVSKWEIIIAGNTTGNPGVSQANPYPYPSNPYPTSCG